MPSKSLAISSPALLAEYVRQSAFAGFLEKRLAAPPDHAALLIRNGQLVDAFTGAHFSIGGILSGIKGVVMGSQHVRILLADLKPFPVQAPIKCITADHVETCGIVTVELQLNPDHPENILGLVGPDGTLARHDVFPRFLPQLTDRVFEAVVGRIDAAELRGHRGVQDLLQGDVMREVERIAGDIGLLVRAVSVEWALNQVEREAMQTATLDREQSAMDDKLERVKRDLERVADATEFELSTELELKALQMKSDDELAHLALSKEIGLIDAREETQRRQELEVLAHEIDVLRGERAGRFENQLAEAEQDIDVAKSRQKLGRLHQEAEAAAQEHLAAMQKLGAFTQLEIEERRKRLDLELNGATQAQTLDHLKGLQGLEHAGDRHDHDLAESSKDGDARRRMEEEKAKTANHIAMLGAGARMAPEQIMAINAGMSPEVAAILAEKARAESSGNEQTMSLMREMISTANDARVSSEEQAREMFRMGMDGAARVAQGAGGGSASTPSAPEATTVECSECGRVNSAKAKFCAGCGHKLRT